MKYKYILFDADDTLLNFKEDEKNAVSALFRDNGIEPTPLLIERYSAINLGLWKQFERGEISKNDIKSRRFTYLLEEMGIEGDGVEYDKKYRFYLSEGGVKFPEADTVCKYLKEKGYRLFIVTNGIEDIQKKRFARAGLNSYFEEFFISEKLNTQKPAKEYFDKVFSSIGSYEKSEYLIIGDSLTSDIAGGINAGIDTCWCNFKCEENSSDYHPVYIISNLSELMGIL